MGCKECKTVAKRGLKCLSCGILPHVSCLKYLKNKDDSTVKCCESVNSEVNTDDLDVSFESTEDFNISDSSEREIYYLKLIIKQKDLVFDNQQITTRSLSVQIDLFKQNNNNFINHQTAQRHLIAKSTEEQMNQFERAPHILLDHLQLMLKILLHHR
ncbi:hypothetical protein JTB14_014186 [Gonioctena quinquepunctata]|nr:hypothetical protein JTB14_014186 [Gonioctena quinquepunctata]